MDFTTHPQVLPAGALPAESQRFYSQAVAACLAHLQRAVELLEQPLLSEMQSAGLLCDIDIQTERLNTLMRQVLAGTGLGALAAGETPERVAVSGLLADLAAEYGSASPGHKFRLRVAASPTVASYAVPSLLIVFQLLLDNALRCTPLGGTIEIAGEADPEGTGWRFHVHDQGAGMAPECLPAFFDNPSQAAPAARHGLGLTLARFVVQAFGGRMWVASQVGQGTTFSFSLPRNSLPRRWTVSRPKVLVIEENSELCTSLKASYEEAGFEVQTSASAEDGLALVSAFAPSLVVLALSPGSLAGQAYLTTLRQCTDAAVLLLVPPADRAAVPDALWQGASDCLVKPFHVRELIARTRAILRRRPTVPVFDVNSGGRSRPLPLPRRPKVNPLLQ